MRQQAFDRSPPGEWIVDTVALDGEAAAVLVVSTVVTKNVPGSAALFIRTERWRST
jgi:hypothetical protein